MNSPADLYTSYADVCAYWLAFYVLDAHRAAVLVEDACRTGGFGEALAGQYLDCQLSCMAAAAAYLERLQGPVPRGFMSLSDSTPAPVSVGVP